MRLSFIAAIVTLLLLLGTINALACTCGGGRTEPCSLFRGDGGVAFIGTVEEVVDTNEKYGKPVKGKVRKITITVNEVFRGSLPSEVVTSDDGYQCDNYPFMLGKTYLIYSKGVLADTRNILPVGLCSGTAPVEKAAESIAFLRQMKSGSMPSVLYGKLQRVVDPVKRVHTPLPRTTVVLTKLYVMKDGREVQPKQKDRFLTTVTDENGDFKFENLEVARYNLSALLPKDLWMLATRDFNAGAVPSCDRIDLYASPAGSVSGKVVNADGTPARVMVNLIAAGAGMRHHLGSVRTDDKGNFTFNGVGEGTYKVEVGLGMYSLNGAKSYLFNPPGTRFPYSSFYYANTFEFEKADTVTLRHAEKVQNVNITMPPAPAVRRLSGIVLEPGGKPVVKPWINLRIKGIDGSTSGVNTREDGTFEMSVFEGFEYEVFAVSQDRSGPQAFVNWAPLKNFERDGVIRIELQPR